MGSKLTNEEFLDNLKKRNIKDKPLEEYKDFREPILFQCHKNEKHVYKKSPADMYKHPDYCPYCNNRKVFVGETDMWTTHPELADMLLNPDDGYKYFATGSQYVDWVCPNCGDIVNAQINQVKMFGLSCKNCGDGMSFSEKFLYNMFKQLGCYFVYNKSMEWSDRKVYDFYIPSMDLIVETHGIQHYMRSFKDVSNKARTLVEEQENDVYKETIAREHGVKHYIQLDCRYSTLDYIKNSILDSELNTLFDLSLIDWDACFRFTMVTTTTLCCNLWNSGMKSTQEIADALSLNICSVITKLTQCADAGLCDYRPHYEKCKPVMCEETNKIYLKIRDVEKDGYSSSNVSRCCRGIGRTAHGMHWHYI